MAPGRVVPPRLLTGSDQAPGTEQAGSAAGWLVWLTVIVVALTLAWWTWWMLRYARSRLSPEERAFRRLASVIGLRREERESLRKLGMEAGVAPIAAIGSPTLASGILREGVGDSKRIRRMRRLLCDTGDDPSGTHRATTHLAEERGNGGGVHDE